MSVVQFPDTIRVPDLQIWNNAAFDETLESDFSKENHSPTLCKSPVCTKSPTPIKPLHPNGATAKSHGKPLKLLFKQGLLPPPLNTARDDKKIDSEIEELEKEISRLSSKLDSLRLEKAEWVSEPLERPKLATPAKITGLKEGLRDSLVPRNNNGVISAKRRGVSLGPSEILVGLRSQRKVNHEKTPIQSTQKRRKSCLFKLEEIDEKGRRSSSLSPKSRTNLSKIKASQKGFMTTIGSKKPGKKDDRRLSSIQPKKLFNEGDKSAYIKKPIKSGRIVASRYNQIHFTQNDRRKTMLPETVKNESKKIDKMRSSSVGKSRVFVPDFSRIHVNEGKKKLVNSDYSPSSISKVSDLLPKIRTIRSTNESPRDSGQAKRVAELVGRKPYFGHADSEEDDSVCQVLSFDDEVV